MTVNAGCPCKKKKCERHGNCEACRAYHAGLKRQRPVACERERDVNIMKYEKCIKESFAVIGKEGSTNDGEGFIKKLWKDANSHFHEVSHLAKKDDHGNILGIWGAMTDFSRSYNPWEDGFTRGLYLAGVECSDDAEAPEGWTKWIIPAYEYLYVENHGSDTFFSVIEYLRQSNIPLAGAVHDFICPETGKEYMFFPVRKL